MIEIALGIVIVLAAAALIVGGGWIGFPAASAYLLLGPVGTVIVAAAGGLLMIDGAGRSVLRHRNDGRRRMQRLRLALTALALIAVLTLGFPALAHTLNLARIGGFPLGFYMAAQGSLIALVIVAFAAVRRQSTIERRDL